MLRVILLLFCVVAASLSTADVTQYRLGAGDLIQISVYDEPDLSLEVRIGLSGKISFPLLGDVEVAGLSPKTVETHLLNRLKGPYLVDPSVTVSIVEYRPFYVTGEVEKPGSYAFHPGLTVDKAISVAGGFTERASKGKIYVIHDSTMREDDSNRRKSVKLYDVVQPGDVITVEQSFF
ncbi:MAG: capsular biosynthesis protein [Oceanospirillaceae bacterium]|nr:capsular biosynthesis protein [Oceanospirillaceae bacterium]|tara:strand:- start:1245 stop:1778 length:534 start_codon:yes stop_codon:yes gene_type:complete